jgi:AcrR family transcriptional regulator
MLKSTLVGYCGTMVEVHSKQRRSDRTRAAILQAARARFATDGFERTTIRAVAADAAIDPSLVMRYYGNKEGLFAAAADFDLALPDLSQVPRDRLGTTAVEHFLARWEGGDNDDGLRLLLASAATNAAAARRLQSIFATQLQPVVAAAVPSAEPDADPGTAATRAGLIATQMLGLAMCRYVLRLPPVVALAHDDIVRWLAPVVQRYLTQAADGGSV